MISRVRRKVFPGYEPVTRGENASDTREKDERRTNLYPEERNMANSNEPKIKTDESVSGDESEEVEEATPDTAVPEHASKGSEESLVTRRKHDCGVKVGDSQGSSSQEDICNNDLLSFRPAGRARRLRQKVLGMKFVRSKRISLFNPKIGTVGGQTTGDNGSPVDNILYSDSSSGQSKMSVPSDSLKNPSSSGALLQAPVIRQNPPKKVATVSILSLYKNPSKKVSLEQFPSDSQSSSFTTRSSTRKSSQTTMESEKLREVSRDPILSSGHQSRRSIFPRLIHLKSSDDVLHPPESQEQTPEIPSPGNNRMVESVAGRRRSRTVGTYDFTKKGKAHKSSSSSTNAAVRPMRSNTSSPLATVFKIDPSSNLSSPPQDPHYTRSYGRSFSGESPPLNTTFKSPPEQSIRQTLVVPDRPPQSYLGASTLSTAKRSNSIVNALSNFVTLRPSSSKSLQKSSLNESNYPKVELDDLPPPPNPEENEPYESYLERLSIYGKFLGCILSSKDDLYKLDCLESYLNNHFDFHRDPLDISLRKVLMFLELPKESQQIDRLLTRVSRVYYRQQKEYYGNFCPWVNEDQVYFVLFSLLMLHTDFFNPNNKKKMTRQEFLNLIHEDTYSHGDKIPLEILAYYYDNILAKESPKFNFLTSRNPHSPLFSPFSSYSSERPSDSDNKLVYRGARSCSAQRCRHRAYSDSVFTPPSSPKSPIERSLSGMIPCQPTGSSNHSNPISTSNDKEIPEIKISRVTRNLIYSPREIIRRMRQELKSENGSEDSANVLNYLENCPHYPSSSSSSSTTRLRAASGSISLSLFSPMPMSPSALANFSLSSNPASGSLTSPFFSSSSSSGASLRDDIDIYNQIFRDSLHNVSMNTQVNKMIPYSFTDKELVCTHSGNNKYGKYFRILKDFKGAYIQISKNQLNKLELSEFSIHNATYFPQQSQLLRTRQPRQYHVKIIHMGEVKESVNDLWKPKVVLLTPLGLFTHEIKQSSLNNLIPGVGSGGANDILITEFHRDKGSGESYYVVNFKSGFEVVKIGEIFAEISTNPEPLIPDDTPSVESDQSRETPLLTIWDSNGRKFSWKLNNANERDNWIDSINLMGSLNETSIEYESLNDTIFPVKEISVAERYQDLMVANQKLIQEFNEYEKMSRLYGQCIPICFKTRNELMNCIKRHAVKIDLSVRDYKRNDTYMFIIKALDLEFRCGFLESISLLAPVLAESSSVSVEGEMDKNEIQVEVEGREKRETNSEVGNLLENTESIPAAEDSDSDSSAEFKSVADKKSEATGDTFRFDELSLVKCVTEEDTVQEASSSDSALVGNLDIKEESI